MQASVFCLASVDGGKFTLVIDAGHGGHDAGAIGTYSQEKNINLNVALAFGKLVERNCNDVKVIYTRKTDVFIPLQERADIANKNKADLFVSIHTNALPNGKIAYGSETYTLGMARSSENFDVAKRENSVILVENDYKEKYAGFNPNSSESYIIFEFMQDEHMKQSISLAQSIQKYYVSLAHRKNKGVHQAGFLVLRETSMPSVLTELGFISTPEEEAYLNSQDGISKLARSIFEGFLDYKQSQDGKIRPTTYKNEDVTPVQTKNEQDNDSVSRVAAAETPNATADNGKENSDNKTAEIQKGKVADNQEQVSVLAQQFGNNESGKQQATADEKNNKASRENDVRHNLNDVRHNSNNVRHQKTQDEAPVFKIQFLTSDTPIKSGDKRLLGFERVENYQEKPGGIIKYTCLSTTDYSEAVANQKEVRKKVADAFIVAFKNGQRVNLADAISEYKLNKSKK